MGRMTLRSASLILSIVMALSLSACLSAGSEPGTEVPAETETDTGAGTVGTDDSRTETEGHDDPGVPSVTFGGADFRIMAEANVSQGERARDVVYDDTLTSNVINEAVHDRNVFIEDKYGVNIVGIFEDTGNMPSLISRNIASGDRFLEAVECSLYYFSSLADRGHLLDLRTMSPHLDLSRPYWDQNCSSALSVANALYFDTGDLMITDKMGTWAIAFNRDLVSGAGLLSLYDVADAGAWTYDVMYEYMTSVCDYDSHDPSDQFGITWGAVSSNDNTYYLWIGCGSNLIVKDQDDIPRLNEISEHAYDAMIKAARVQYDKTLTLLAEDVVGVRDTHFDGTIRIFEEGRSLFFVGSMTIVEWMRAYDVDFGVLPMPKTNTEQKRYHCTVSNTRSWAYGIPAFDGMTQADKDYVAIVTQALACESTDTLLKAYYDTTMVYQGLRREVDIKMLDLIFDSRMYDLSLVYRWADPLISQIMAARSQKMVMRLQSMYDSYAAGIGKAIEESLSGRGKG